MVRMVIALAIMALILQVLPGKAAVAFSVLVILGALMVSPEVLS